MEIKYINPNNMAKPRGYSQAISVAGNYKTIYIGGQNAIDENRNIYTSEKWNSPLAPLSFFK